MDRDVSATLVVFLVFCVTALVAYVAVTDFKRRSIVRRRFRDLSDMRPVVTGKMASKRRLIKLTPLQLGLDVPNQRRTRGELIRAGFFNPNSVVNYTLARWLFLGLLPFVGALIIFGIAGPHWDALTKITAIAVLVAIGYYLPPAFISRRQRWLQDKYRVTFPDVLDMVVVCVNAGLSLDAALNRVAQECGPENAELRANLDLMSSEMRAGRSTMEALKDCAERLGLPEAMSLAMLMQQSIELGTDVALSLKTFSDEMRDKRMSRAEERAAALPPKLTLPLGLFIFPVVLIVVLTPVIMRIVRTSGV